MKSTGLIGSASIVTLVIGLIRSKILAQLVGVAGIGLLGILNTVMTAATAIGSCGLSTSAVRAIASSGGRDHSTRLAIWSLALTLGVLTGIAIWIFKEPISIAVAADATLQEEIGWLSLGATLAILAATQIAILQGLRRLRDVAVANVLGSLLGAVAGVIAVWLWGLKGVVAAVITAPAGVVIVGRVAARGARVHTLPSDRQRLDRIWRKLLSLGSAVVITAALNSLWQVFIRSAVLRHGGFRDAGLLQAAVAISTMNVGLVLAAMSADYFPRLVEAQEFPQRFNLLFNQQLHVAFLLSATVLLALSTGATAWLPLFYSREFASAATLLRWQVVAEVIRIACWAFGFVLLARGDNRSYILVELAMGAAVVPLVWFLVPAMGLVGAGLAYAAGYACALVATGLLCRSRHGIKVDATNWRLFAELLALVIILAVVGSISNIAALILGAAAMVWSSLTGLAELRRMDALPTPVAALIGRLGGRGRV